MNVTTINKSTAKTGNKNNRYIITKVIYKSNTADTVDTMILTAIEMSGCFPNKADIIEINKSIRIKMSHM